MHTTATKKVVGVFVRFSFSYKLKEWIKRKVECIHVVHDEGWIYRMFHALFTV
jgi:hypothetical protein